MSDYEPELGQELFGQPHKQFECPAILDAALMSISNELRRVMWNVLQSVGERPFENSGEAFRCDVFGVWAYDWVSPETKPQPYNFKHAASGLEVSWYKYFGRGMSSNMDVTPDLASRILTECLEAIRSVEGGTPFVVGSVGDVPYFEAS